MHVRITTIIGAADLDAGIEDVRQRSGYIRRLSGCQGLVLAVDRMGNKASILTLWDSEGDIDAADADPQVQEIRAKGKVAFGAADQTVQRFEVATQAGGVASEGSSLLTRNFSVDPGQVDEILQRFRTEVLPELQGMAGFVAAAQFIDRATGQGHTGTVWEDDASREAANEATQKFRDAVEGVTFEEPDRWEVVYLDV
jgi:heme-degrading monooxygenase HmoA